MPGGGWAAGLRRRVAWFPEWWLYGVAVVAGLVLVLGLPAGGAAAPGHQHHQDHAGGGTGGTGGTGWTGWAGWPGWVGWMVMVLAMMPPLVAPQARQVALRALWPRRQRAIGELLGGYLAVWAGIGAVVVAGAAAVGWSGARDGAPTAVAALLLTVAALWHVAPPRRRLLRRCESPRPVAARGWAASRGGVASGGRAGLRCVATCGPAMLAMPFAHSPWLMLGVLGVFLRERSRGPNPERRAARPAQASALLVAAVLTGAGITG